MNRVQIKFCGFRTEKEVDEAVQLPVDAVGFILVPGRKRTIRVDRLSSLVRRVAEPIWTVGVFQNAPLEEIIEVLEWVPLRAVQLHGDESPSFCRSLKERSTVKIIKAFHVGEEIADQRHLPEFAPWIDVALLDAASGQRKGGTGQTFAWEKIPPFGEACRREKIPLWIAGGLHEENVLSLISRYRPQGIDVSSGIEAEGRKDPERMKRLVRKVKRYERGR